MRKSDMIKIMSLVQQFFEKFTVTDSKTDAWYSLFENYDGDIMLAATKDYAMSAKYPPSPEQLKTAYWQIVEKRKQAVAAEAKQKADEGELCPWCAGTGWFSTEDKYGYSFVCRCQCQGDPTQLNKALACPTVRWDEKRRAFVPKTEWVGAEKKAVPPDEILFGDLVKSL